jgi:hypothetical protein
MFKSISVAILVLAGLMSAVVINSKSALGKVRLPEANFSASQIQIMPSLIQLEPKNRATPAYYIRVAKKNRRYRRGRRYYRRHHRDGISPGAAAAIIIGGILINEAFRAKRRSDFYRCDEDYLTFRWSDGTFQPYGGGPRRLCPYLY